MLHGSSLETQQGKTGWARLIYLHVPKANWQKENNRDDAS